ncbi:MAG: DUF6048 family protein [Marinoscillum sp.]|uniref:DUF6048 family protein n=1 Tax=Marinoscillum sp. TaxID=2024838 RepID=UPI0032FA6504
MEERRRGQEQWSLACGFKMAAVVLGSILFSTTIVFAQRPAGQRPQPSGNTQKTNSQLPKEPRDFRPSMLKLSVDAVPVGISLFGADRSGSGYQALIDFDQFFFAAEYGTQKTSRGELYSYKNEGSYFSFGPEVNFLKNNAKGNSLTFGLRYGQAQFSDELSYLKTGGFFGDLQVEDANPDLKARWLELTVGLNANVWSNLYLGYTIRYKVLRQVDNIGTMAPYDVPGFGLYEDNTGVQFNFYVGWAIPLREKFPEPALEN